MPSRELINPPNIHESPGYSHIAVTDAKKMIFLAGQVALDEDFKLIGGDDLYLQTRATVANAVRALEAAGATWDDILRRTIYTTQPLEWDTMTRAIVDETGETDHPPQTVAGVAGLGLEELLLRGRRRRGHVEIEQNSLLDFD